MKVEDFFAALLESLSKARALSDGRSLEVGRLYRQHEILRHFPVPRYTMSELTIDFKCAFSRPERRFVELEDESRSALLELLRGEVEAFPTAASLPREYRRSAELREAWRSRVPELLGEVESWVSRAGPIDVGELAHRLTRLLFDELEAILAPSERVPRGTGMTSPRDRESEYGDRLTADLRAYLSRAGGPQEPAPVDLLFSPADLGEVPDALLSSVRVVFRPVDRKWVADDLDGKSILRLK